MVMSFPECIYAIGGAGKELIFNMLKQEWILKEILRPDHNPNKCIVTIIDTCREDDNEDTRSIREIKGKISKITDSYIDSSLDAGMTVGEIKIIYHLLTKELLLQDPVDLGGIGVKDAVLKATDAECWWINDDQISEDWFQKLKSRENLQNLNFTKGVYRKRAIAKAIYYKSLAESKFEVEVLGRNIDIICGFGGGTGSGIALSLAKKIKEEKPASDIHLFGVISTLKESDEEKANCAAMLSELEYMKVGDTRQGIDKNAMGVSENNVFRNIVLLPIEPTDYGGEQIMDNMVQYKIKEFDDVFPYVLIAFHNTPGGQPAFLDSRSFAPFSIAIPQLVRYNVNYIRQIKNSLAEKISDKEKSLESESEIYKLVNSYLEKYNDSDNKHIEEKNLLDEDVAFVQERYKQLKTVLNCKIFDKLEYKNVLELKKIVEKIDRIEPAENESYSTNIEEIIINIQSEIDGEGLNNAAKTSTETDYSTYSVLVNDLKKIALLINVIKKINTLDDDLIKRVLRNCVKPQNEVLGTRLTQIREARAKAEKEEGLLKIEYKDLKNECIKYTMEREKDAESINCVWKENSEIAFKKLSATENARKYLIGSFESIQKDLGNYINEINRCRSESEIKVITPPSSQIKNDFSKFFEIINLHEIDCREIEELKEVDVVFSNIKKMKLAYITSRKSLPIIDQAIPGDTKAKIKRREAKQELEILRAEFKNSKVIKFLDGSFSFEFNYSIEKKIDNKLDEHIQSIIAEPREKFYNKDTKQGFEKLEIQLKNPIDRYNASIKEIVKSYRKYEDGLKEFKEKVNKKDHEVNAISIKIKKYDYIESLLKNIATPFKNHLDSLSVYNSYFLGVDNMIENRRCLPEKPLFVKEIQPRDIFNILASQSDINTVIRDTKEKQVLVSVVKDSFHQIREKRYNTLAVNSFSTEKFRWEWTNLGCVMITQAQGIEEVFEGISTYLIGEFCITNNSRFNNWIVPYGDDWGVGIVSFISPVPLDNLKNFVDVMEGYFQAYQKMKRDPDKLSVLHNSLLLEKGLVVERKGTFDLETKDDNRRQFLENEMKTKELVANNIELNRLSDIAKTIK